MPKHHQLSLPPVQVSSVDTRPSITGQGEVNPVDVPGAMRESVKDAKVQHKEAALSAGCAEETWTRILNCERGIRLDQLGRLPNPVQQEFVARWGRQLGMRVTREDIQKQAAANLVKAAADFLAEIA